MCVEKAEAHIVSCAKVSADNFGCQIFSAKAKSAMTISLPRYLCVVAWLIFANSLFAQGVFSTNRVTTTNLAVPFVEIISISNGIAQKTNTSSAAEVVVSGAAGGLDEIISRPVEFPGAVSQPRRLENPSASALRMAILELAGIIIVPCLLCACVMIAKKQRRAARICLVAAAIVGIVCLIALIMVDSLG
jgi:hypothetical protein